MQDVSTTRLSSRGQVVIPESVRQKLGLETGDEFVVVAERDVVVLKVLARPSMNEFDTIIAKARKQAKAAGLKRLSGLREDFNDRALARTREGEPRETLKSVKKRLLARRKRRDNG